jgi:hypothetical protein
MRWDRRQKQWCMILIHTWCELKAIWSIKNAFFKNFDTPHIKANPFIYHVYIVYTISTLCINQVVQLQMLKLYIKITLN